MTAQARITVEWALWGKEPDARDYSILASSDGQVSDRQFAAIITHYAIGSTTELPQVTISPIRIANKPWIGMAIHEASETRDWVGRPVTTTRFHCFPYAQIADKRITYEALFDALRTAAFATGLQVALEVPLLDPASLAAHVTPLTIGAAAHVINGRNVRVVDAQAVDLRARIRCLDAVAALLPYGMRARLTAATWIVDTIEPRFQVVFARLPDARAETMSWDDPPQRLAPGGGAAEYWDKVRGAGPHFFPLIERLALANDPFEFGVQDMKYALAVVGEATTAPAPSSVAQMLGACADALDNGDLRAVEHALVDLTHALAAAPPDQEQRRRHWKLIGDRRMLADRGLPPELARRLHDTLLTEVFGPQLTTEAYLAIESGVDQLHDSLFKALLDMPMEDVTVALLMGERSPEALSEVLSRMTAQDVFAIASKPMPRPWFELVLEELVRRCGSEDLVARLHESGYLADRVAAAFPDNTRRQISLIADLLRACHGQRLTADDLDQILGGRPVFPRPTLLAAALLMYGPGGAERLLTVVFPDIYRAAGLDPATLQEVERLLRPRQSFWRR